MALDERSQNIALLNLDYLNADEAALIVSERCAAFGHPPKKNKAVELKRDWEKGCRCGRNPYA